MHPNDISTQPEAIRGLLQQAFDNRPAPVQFPQEVLGRHHHMVKDDLVLMVCCNALQWGDRDARAGGINQEDADSFFRGRPQPGPGHTEEVIRDMSILDKELGAAQ